MTLLGRPGLVILQNGVDHAKPRNKLGPPHRLLPLIPRRRRIRQHLPHRLARQTELPSYRPLALALDKGCPSHSRIQFHRIHPSGVPRGYFRPLILWGPAIAIFFVWTIVGVSSIYEHPMRSALRPNTVAVFLFLGVASIVGLAYSLRRIAHYNREVYPRLRWNWEHTYICRRCGKFRLVPS